MSKQQSEQELLEFQKLAIEAKQFLTDHEIEAASDTLAGHMALWIQRRVEAQLTERDTEQYSRNDVIKFSAELVYRFANPDSKMDVPNVAYEIADKKLELFDSLGRPMDWDASETPQTKEEE